MRWSAPGSGKVRAKGVAMLHIGQHEYAMVAFSRVVELSPGLPEAHVNLGYALLGLKHYAKARESFVRAIDLKPEQANAYYGLGIAFEKSGDLAAALGAMRTYVHLTPDSVPQVRKAKSAIWEWETLIAKSNRRVSR